MKPKERRQRNLKIKSTVKTLFKKAEAALKKGAADLAKITAAISQIDRAVAKGIIHRNTAARKKSRLMKKLAKSKKK